MQDTSNMSSAEIGNLIDEKERLLREANENLSCIENEDIRISREIILLQLKRKDNQILLSKAKHNVKRINSELRELRNRFWTAKNSGL